jgi:hypothetical protein
MGDIANGGYQMNISKEAELAHLKGVEDGTINDTIEEIYYHVLNQEVISYCSSKGSYTFDIYDFTGS